MMQLFSEFLVFILEIFATVVIVNVIFFVLLLFKNRNATKQSKEAEPEQIVKYGHIVNQEKHNDTFYWYDENTQEFLVQGKTLEDIVAGLKIRYPDHLFILPTGHTIYGPDWKLIKLGDQ